MDNIPYRPYKVNETIFRGFLNENTESLTLKTLQCFFNETIESFSEKWILILDDQYNSDDFSVPSTHRYSGHKYCILMDYETKSRYKIGVPNPKGITSIENRQKSVIIYDKQSLLPQNIHTVFEKYLKSNSNSYIASDLKNILIDTFSLLFEQEKGRYYETMKRCYQPVKSQSALKESKIAFSEVDDIFLSHNIDEKSIESNKESILKYINGLFKIQSVNRKDILFKNYSNKKLIFLIDFSLDTFDLMRSINEYVRGDASIHLDWEDRRSFRFNSFSSILLEDFSDKAITEDSLKIVRERISEKIEDIQEKSLQFKELVNNQNKFSYSILRIKKHSGNGFNSFEFRSKELLFKFQLKTKAIFSLIISQIGKFVNTPYQRFIILVKKPWFHIPLAYVILSILSAFFQAWFNGKFKLSDLIKWARNMNN